MNIFETIQKIIKKKYPQIKQKIELKTILGDINFLDSLELAIIAIELENIYNIRFPDNQLDEIKGKTIAELIAEIEKLIKNQEIKKST